MTTKKNKKSDAVKFLESLVGEETFGSMLEAFRLAGGLSQVDFAKRLGISKQHLCDLEKGRRFVTVQRAAKFAKILGHSEKGFVQLALQDQIRESGLPLKVSVEAAA